MLNTKTFTIAMSLSFALFSGGANAEPRLSQLNKLKDNESFQIYLEGVGSGISWYSTYSNEKTRLFCEPENLSLNHLNYIQLIEAYLKKNASTVSSDTPVNLVLLEALIDAFPCKK